MKQYLDTIWKNGYAGALVWSYRATDEASDFKPAEQELTVWSRAHEAATDIDLRKKAK